MERNNLIAWSEHQLAIEQEANQLRCHNKDIIIQREQGSYETDIHIPMIYTIRNNNYQNTTPWSKVS